MQTGVWVRWETSPKSCAQLYYFNLTRFSSPVRTHCLMCVCFSGALVSNKPGVCVKVLSLESISCRLQEDMAQLADCAMPPVLRVREENSNWIKICFHNRCIKKTFSPWNVSRLDLVNFPLTEWITSQRVPTSASESTAMISCVTRYFSRCLANNIMTWDSGT